MSYCLKEHELLRDQNNLPVQWSDSFKNLRLVHWGKSPDEDSSFGYYASFNVGAEWIDESNTLIVTTKSRMEQIDFLTMFMHCLSSGLALESLDSIYQVDADKPSIVAPVLNSVLSPLILIHFLSVVKRIRALKRGYVHHARNLKKIRGRIKPLQNERLNIVRKRYDRIFCEYDEFSVDIPENRLIKKALVFCKAFLERNSRLRSMAGLQGEINRQLNKFAAVSETVELKAVTTVRAQKLFNEYSEAVRLAKIILKQFDYNINQTDCSSGKVIPFVLNMSLLYEHYVYALLHKAYQGQVIYQFDGETGKPDFLYVSRNFKAIIDTKYIPKYEEFLLDTYVVRQLSGYGRDLKILKCLGCDGVSERSMLPTVPCIIVYPCETGQAVNPFIGKNLSELCREPEKNLVAFYKIAVPVPVLSR